MPPNPGRLLTSSDLSELHEEETNLPEPPVSPWYRTPHGLVDLREVTHFTISSKPIEPKITAWMRDTSSLGHLTVWESEQRVFCRDLGAVPSWVKDEQSTAFEDATGVLAEIQAVLEKL